MDLFFVHDEIIITILRRDSLTQQNTKRQKHHTVMISNHVMKTNNYLLIVNWALNGISIPGYRRITTNQYCTAKADDLKTDLPSKYD